MIQPESSNSELYSQQPDVLSACECKAIWSPLTKALLTPYWLPFTPVLLFCSFCFWSTYWLFMILLPVCLTRRNLQFVCENSKITVGNIVLYISRWSELAKEWEPSTAPHYFELEMKRKHCVRPTTLFVLDSFLKVIKVKFVQEIVAEIWSKQA